MTDLTTSNTTHSVIPFYSSSLCVVLWLGLFLIQLVLAEFHIDYFPTMPLLFSLGLSLVGIWGLQHTYSDQVAGWLLALSFMLYAFFSRSSIVYMSSILMIGLIFGRCVLSKEAISKLWFIGIGIFLVPLLETIPANFPTFLAALGFILPCAFMYSLVALLLYIEATDNDDIIHWALTSQQKDAQRANLFFEQRQQLQQAIKREEYHSWHLAS